MTWTVLGERFRLGCCLFLLLRLFMTKSDGSCMILWLVFGEIH